MCDFTIYAPIAYRPAIRSRLQARPVTSHTVGSASYHGGQCWAINGDVVTLRIDEWTHAREVEVPMSMVEGDGPLIVGDGVIVRLVAGEVTHAKAAASSYLGTDQAGAVAQGLFSPAILNGEISGVHQFQDEG